MRVESSSVELQLERSSSGFKVSLESLKVLPKNKADNEGFQVSATVKGLGEVNLNAGSEAELKELILKRLLEILTGREIKLLSLKDITPQSPPDLSEPEFAMEYKRTQIDVETETLNVYAYGKLRTSDGREVNFSLELVLTNVEVEVSSQSVRAGSLAIIDPLIINLNGSPDILSDSEFSFDLNFDGKEEKIPELAEGKGFIFFDENNDNLANDGRELIGVKSGDAFGELKELDTDGNGWIDEGDSTLESLKVWLKTPLRDEVKSLKELGIGALYTGSAGTNFPLGGKGVIRDVGVYLKENADVGSLFKVDFFV